MGLLSRLFGQEGPDPGAPSASSSSSPRLFSITTPDGKVVPDLVVLDLRDLDSVRTRIVGSSHWISDAGRAKHGGTEYLLVREPRNRHDAQAVAVYGKGRKVGHVSASKAAAMAPVLDALGADAYLVGGTSVAETSIRLWIDLPRVGDLRDFAKSRSR